MKVSKPKFWDQNYFTFFSIFLYPFSIIYKFIFFIIKLFVTEKKFSIPKFSQIEWKPLNFIDVDDESNARTLLKLLETLEELDDVQSVSSNFNINDSLMEKII